MIKLEGLTYWKLKAELLQLALEEQIVTHKKLQLTVKYGLPTGNFVLDDNSLSVVTAEDVSNANSQKV